MRIKRMVVFGCTFWYNPQRKDAVSIKFKARVLLELGAELISSDAVALYELIKNGIDAQSKQVIVDIHVAMQRSSVQRLLARWKEGTRWDVKAFMGDVEAHLEPTAPKDARDAFLGTIGNPRRLSDAITALERAVLEHNVIAVRDTGLGMTPELLKSCYLTVGTPGRLHEKRAAIQDETKQRVPLGEKGIGRLAAMRLGHVVEVYTGMKGESHWNVLELDWRPLFTDPDLNAEKLQFNPILGAEKGAAKQGTDILIRDLQSDWSTEKLQALWLTDLSKLADPFDDEFAARFLRLNFQGVRQTATQPFDRALLDKADAYCRVTYRTQEAKGPKPDPRLQVYVEYRRFSAAATTEYSGPHLRSAVSEAPKKKGRAKAADLLPSSDEVVAGLMTLGDFDAEFYWFNRGRLRRDDLAQWQSLEPFVKVWSGGLLVYRDGYRVYPYGSGADDWLDLDRKALASSSFKLNRAQIVGRLVVTSRNNPALKDQTNREGFRDCPEKEALRRLLRTAIIGDCKSFLGEVEKGEKVDANTIGAIDKKISTSRSAAQRALLAMQKRVPAERNAIQEVLVELSEVEDAWKRAKEALTSQNAKMNQYFHLAGVGLSAAFIAHELARSTEHALQLLQSTQSSPVQLDALRAQLKTINKRVRVIDELSIAGRQIKSNQDIGVLVALIVDVYDAKATRHGISVSVTTNGKARTLWAERGQVIQILDNLMSNSMYWLQHRDDRSTKPRIEIHIDYKECSLRFADNGAGIPVSIAPRVFEAFFSTKPAGEGRGLGLAIARQLAEDNDMEIGLLPAEKGSHPGFMLVFKGA